MAVKVQSGHILIAGALVLLEVIYQFSERNQYIWPAPSRVLHSLLNAQFLTDALWNAALTMTRAAVGLSLAFALAVPLGLAFGILPWLRRLLLPLIECLRPIPSAAVVPIAMISLGLGTPMMIFVIAFGAFWPLVMSSTYGACAVTPAHNDLARTLRMSRWEKLRFVVAPTAVPSIATGLRISIPIALILAVTAEMLAGQNGLGFEILDRERAFRYSEMYACIAIIGLIGYVANILFMKFSLLLSRRFPSVSQ